MNRYNMTEAIRATGLTQTRVLDIVQKAGGSVIDGIPADVINDVAKEQETYISFREFAAKPRGDRYNGSTSCKNKLLDELELNDYYGVELFDPEDLLIGVSNDIVFFRRVDVPKLEFNLVQFFGLYALTEEEKIERLLNGSNRMITKACLEEYMVAHIGEGVIQPSFTEFISLLLSLPDLPSIKNEDIKRILSLSMTTAAKDTLVSFLNYGKVFAKTKYSRISRAKPESRPIPAYSNKTYLVLARCIFNAEYIDRQKMIERALDNHCYIEMWLYLALHFCCGWRAGDICKGWRYLNLSKDKENPYGIDVETLYDDILYDKISNEVYEQVCEYAVGKVRLSGQSPSKTAGASTPPLTIAIDPTLTTFFGLLTLIAECVMLRTGDGYMRENRATMYQNKALYRQFFGQEMYDILHGQNIHSRRLNKDYLQGLEETALQSGCGSLMASAVASYARSHSNLDTIAHYLNDHTLTAENAEMVIFYMLERGVFGFELYRTLITAYPDAMQKLPMKKQNELMVALATNPLQIELEQSGIAAKLHLKDRFEEGNTELVAEMLKGMFEITQGRGKAKDEGIHCIYRARGNLCKYPEFDSCLANACPYLVFTRYGYAALLEVIRDYKVAADAGDVKKENVLKKVIMPHFTDIINTLMRDVNMAKNERMGLRIMLEETLRSEDECA